MSKSPKTPAENKNLKNEDQVVDGAAAIKIEPFKEDLSSGESVYDRIKRENTSPDHQETIDKNWGELVSAIDNSGLEKFLRTHGFEVIDKRHVGGSLWVIHQQDFKGLVPVLASRGILFLFAPNGSGSTNGRPAWYVKLKR